MRIQRPEATQAKVRPSGSMRRKIGSAGIGTASVMCGTSPMPKGTASATTVMNSVTAVVSVIVSRWFGLSPTMPISKAPSSGIATVAGSSSP